MGYNRVAVTVTDLEDAERLRELDGEIYILLCT